MESYKQLEIKWAEFNDLDPAGMVACSSGTAALHLALEAFRLPQGSEVIVPNFTMVACPRAVVMAGLRPVFVDCRQNLIMDYSMMWNEYLSKDSGRDSVNAVMAVHVYGRDAKVRENLFVYLAGESKDFIIIEDLAEAHGIKPSQVTDAACWSFYRNKIVAGEEGGAVWFRDSKHAELARQLRSLGFTDAHDFDHVPRGHNYRMANCLAAKVLESLSLLQNNLRLRRKVEEEYNSECPPDWRMPYREAPWVYDLRIPGMTADKQTEVVEGLQALGIQARHAFKPMSNLREFQGCPVYGRGEALKASREVIYLPLTSYHPMAFPTIRQVLGK